MAYNQTLASRIRNRFSVLENVEEKEMMGGLVFMYNGKMCVGIIKDEMMLRIPRELHEAAVEQNGCRTMDFTKRPMWGYVLIDEGGIAANADFEKWICMALDFNAQAKASKKKK